MIEPDEDAIKAHLDQLCEPARWDYPDGLVEICHGPATAPLSLAALFSVSEAGVAEAVKYAISVNRRGENTYVGVNPRKRNTNPGKRAADRDVEIAFFQFADLDEKDAVERSRRGMPLRPIMVVMTGTEPHQRPHFYWRLTEPVMNLDAWTERQRGIAQSIGGDAVINPSRVMRLAGTVNFPLQHKVERGYRVELTTIRTSFPNERPHVTPEQVALAYPVREQPSDEIGQLNGQTTLAAMRGTRIADLLAACRDGREWHNNMVRLVAHLAAIGRSNAEIIGLAAGITLSGFTVDQTERDMIAAIDSARRKWSLPEPPDTVEAEEATRDPADSVFETLSLDDLEALPPPTYLIDEIVPEHGMTILYGDPGSYKSFVAVDMGLRIAFGMDWHGAPAKQVGVLYIAGEGRHGLGKRVKGWRREHGLEGVDAPFKLLPVAVHMLDKQSVEKLKRTILAVQEEVSFDIGIVFIDTVSRAIPGHDENKQDAMSLFVDGCATIQDFTNGAVAGVHHSGKDKERGMRGSSVLLGGIEASIKVSKDGQTVTLNVEKQKDDEEAAPIYMTMKKVEWSIGLEKPITTLIPEKSTKPTLDEKALSRRQADEIFDEVDAAWASESPWSAFPQAKRKGRYLVDYIAETYGVTNRVAENHITAWQFRGYMKTDTQNTRQKASGLRVLKRLEADQ